MATSRAIDRSVTGVCKHKASSTTSLNRCLEPDNSSGRILQLHRRRTRYRRLGAGVFFHKGQLCAIQVCLDFGGCSIADSPTSEESKQTEGIRAGDYITISEFGTSRSLVPDPSRASTSLPCSWMKYNMGGACRLSTSNSGTSRSCQFLLPVPERQRTPRLKMSLTATAYLGSSLCRICSFCCCSSHLAARLCNSSQA